MKIKCTMYNITCVFHQDMRKSKRNTAVCTKKCRFTTQQMSTCQVSVTMTSSFLMKLKEDCHIWIDWFTACNLLLYDGFTYLATRIKQCKEERQISLPRAWSDDKLLSTVVSLAAALVGLHCPAVLSGQAPSKSKQIMTRCSGVYARRIWSLCEGSNIVKSATVWEAMEQSLAISMLLKLCRWQKTLSSCMKAQMIETWTNGPFVWTNV